MKDPFPPTKADKQYEPTGVSIKLKEYLMNHMVLKGECGNYNSAISSLKWFAGIVT